MDDAEKKKRNDKLGLIFGQIIVFIILILVVLVISLIFTWISSSNAYLHDFVKNPNDPRRGDLKKLVDVSMGIALFTVVISLMTGYVTFVILELCAILLIGITSTIYLGNTENPNFNRDFPTFWITTSIILNSMLILIGTGMITAKKINDKANRTNVTNIIESDAVDSLGLWATFSLNNKAKTDNTAVGLDLNKKNEARFKVIEEMLDVGGRRSFGI